MLCFYAVWELLLLLRSLHDGLRKRAQQLKNGTYNREIQAAVCVSYIDQDFTGFLGLLERTTLRGCRTDNLAERSCYFFPLQKKQEDWVSLRSQSREPVRRIMSFELKSYDSEGKDEFRPPLPLLAGFFRFLEPLHRLAPTRPLCLCLGPLPT